MANAPVIQGVRSTRLTNQNNQMPDYLRKMMLLEPYQTPFTQFLFWQAFNAKKVINAQGKFNWFEDQFLPHQITTTDVVTAVAGKLTLTNLNVDTVDVFKVNDRVYIEETDEEAFVESVATNQAVLVGVADGVNQTPPNLTSLTAGNGIKIIFNAQFEGSGAPDPRTTLKVEVSNYLTMLKETVTLTGREIAGETWSDGTTHAEEVRKKISEVKLQMERNFMLALKAGINYGADGKVQSYGRGALGTFTTNVSTYTAPLLEADLDAHIESIQRGGMVKTHYCGTAQFNDIQKFLKDKIQVQKEMFVTPYGVNVTQYRLGHYLFNLVWNPVLDGKFTDWGITIDHSRVKMRFMADDDKGQRKFRVRTNVQDPDVEEKKTVILSDVGIMLANEETGGILHPA